MDTGVSGNHMLPEHDFNQKHGSRWQIGLLPAHSQPIVIDPPFSAGLHILDHFYS